MASANTYQYHPMNAAKEAIASTNITQNSDTSSDSAENGAAYTLQAHTTQGSQNLSDSENNLSEAQKQRQYAKARKARKKAQRARAKVMGPKPPRVEAQAAQASRKVINGLCTSLVSGGPGNCRVADIRDLQIKCHAPKEGNRHISYEFYGTAPDDRFGSNFTKQEAIALLNAFYVGAFWQRPIYRKQWLEIGKSAGVEIPEPRPIKPREEIHYSPVTGRPVAAIGPNSTKQVLANLASPVEGGAA